MPAGCILERHMTSMEMAHGGFIYIPFLNAPLYGLLGFVLGIFFNLRRYALYIVVAIVMLVIVSVSVISTRESLKRNNDIQSMKAGHEHLLKNDPNNVHSLFWLGVHHFSRTHNYKEAKGYFEKVLTLVPPEENAEGFAQSTMLYLAMILKSEGQDEQAKQMYARFQATKPDFKNNCTLFNYNNMARMKLGLPQEVWKP
jgi:tetratricopeptide (TPR) repeat protein